VSDPLLEDYLLAGRLDHLHHDDLLARLSQVRLLLVVHGLLVTVLLSWLVPVDRHLSTVLNGVPNWHTLGVRLGLVVTRVHGLELSLDV
jgi:hypothetical protein